jgi:hypothetical protein
MNDLTDKDQMTIKEAFDFLMKEHFSDYSTYKVEKMSGLSGNAIHKVLTGYSPATFRIVEALAKAVGKQPYIMFSTRTSKQIKEARAEAQAKLKGNK